VNPFYGNVMALRLEAALGAYNLERMNAVDAVLPGARSSRIPQQRSCHSAMGLRPSHLQSCHWHDWSFGTNQGI
jgi:hypothetical protein